MGAGADVTVAVNLLGSQTLPAWPGDERSTTSARRPVRDTLVESIELGQIGASARQTAMADAPIFGPGTWRNFELADRYMAAGAEAMEAALPDLHALARPQGNRYGSARGAISG